MTLQVNSLVGFGSGGYVQNIVSNNVTGFLDNAGTFSLGADSDNFTLSLWLNQIDVTATDRFLSFGVGTGGVDRRVTLLYASSANPEDIRVELDASAIFGGSTNETVSKGVFHHFLLSRRSTILQLYVDDSALTFGSAPSSATQAFSTFDFAQICKAPADSVVDGKWGDIWFFPGNGLDLSVVANRRKFINADLTAVDLGPSGNLPIGSSPPLFLGGTMVAVDWNAGTNLGTGGAFTHSGANFTDG